MTEAVSAEPDLSWEKECQRRIGIWHKELMRFGERGELGNLQTLKAVVDVQLALAELKLKARQADWAKTIIWLSLVLPTAGAIVGAFIGGWLKHS